MTNIALVGPAVAVAPPEPALVDERLSNLLDLQILDEIGWDPATLIFRLPSDHPVVGWAKCGHHCLLGDCFQQSDSRRALRRMREATRIPTHIDGR